MRRAVERVSRICSAEPDPRTLRLEVLEELRQAVGFDAYAWLLTDPATAVGCAPLADVPCLDELPRLIRLKYLTPLNRWTSLVDPVARLRASTGGRPEESLLWREMLAGLGVWDVASLVFRDRFGCWAFLELWRVGADAPFDDDEAALLAEIVPVLTQGLRRGQAQTFVAASEEADRTGPLVLVLSPDLDVRAQTPDTDAFLRALVPPPAERSPVPSGAYNVAAQLLAVEAGVADDLPSARVHLGGGRWLTLRAARMGDPRDAASDIAVTIEETSVADRLDLFVRAFALSRREGELLEHLASGADTRDAAARMFLSRHTVQDHLKSIFHKTGTRNRRALLARSTGR